MGVVVAPYIERCMPIAIKLATWLGCIGIAYQAALITWTLITPATLDIPKPGSGTIPLTSVSKSDSLQYALADFHLLGIADAGPENAQQEQVAAPETRLNFELKGILAGEKGSSAIIAQTGGAGEYFKVGDRVFNRARLTDVFDDHVLLDNRGKLEKLVFEDSSGRLIQKGSNSKAPSRPLPPKKNQSRSDNNFNNRVKKIDTPEEFVDLARAELLEDPRQALDNLGVEASGEGYRVTPKAGMLLGLGMQPGDVIISINGQPLGDIEQDQGLIDEVYTAGQARIEVQRGSRRFIINHSFR